MEGTQQGRVDMTDFVISEEEMLQLRTHRKANPLGEGHGSLWLPMAYYELDSVMEKALSHPLSDELKGERMSLLKDLQEFIDNADSHIGCPNGTIGTAYLVQWMGGQGYDCD